MRLGLVRLHIPCTALVKYPRYRQYNRHRLLKRNAALAAFYTYSLVSNANNTRVVTRGKNRRHCKCISKKKVWSTVVQEKVTSVSSLTLSGPAAGVLLGASHLGTRTDVPAVSCSGAVFSLEAEMRRRTSISPDQSSPVIQIASRTMCYLL